MRCTLKLSGLLLAILLAWSVSIAEPPAADPAGPILAAIAGKEDSAFKSGPWTYQYHVSGKGSRGEGHHGKLLYNGKEVTTDNNNDRINTPWGTMYWHQSRIFFGEHGWMLKPVVNQPDGKLIPEPTWGPDAATTQPTSQPVELTAKANGTTTALKPGQDLIVRLAGNPTTGFHWEVKSVTGKAVAAVGEVEYKADPAPRQMVGSGGMFVAKFHAAAPGQSVITMVYRRPWEKDVAPIETFTVTVDVKE